MKNMGNNSILGRSLGRITIFMAIAAIVCATSATRLYAHTVDPVIGLPDIGWDSAGGALDTTFTPGTGLLSMSGSIVSFIPDVTPAPLLVGGTFSLNASLVSASLDGSYIHADFGTSSPASGSYDVEIRDTAGVLALGGNFGDFTINAKTGIIRGSGGAVFTPLAGYLAGDFAGLDAGMVHVEFNATPSWYWNSDTDNSFTAGWSSESKGDIGPVPEPGTIALLGSGLLGMLGYSRRRFNFWKKG